MLKSHTPLLIPLSALIAGIIIGSKNDFDLFYLSILIAGLIVIYLIANPRLWKSIMIPMLFFSLGFFSFHVSNVLKNPLHYSNIEGQTMIIKITKKEETRKGFRYFAKVKSVKSSELSFTSTGNLMIYTDSLIQLEQYEFYELPYYTKKIDRFQNPGTFDYGTYLANQNIYHLTYLKESPIHIKTPMSFLKWMRDKRNAIAKIFDNHISRSSSSEIIKTLLLGEKKGLDQETKTIFVNNGLAHLLAISGMHVGIILIILNFIFGRITIRILKYSLIILGIWFYILLSGVQIPAVRAGFMFSLMVIGQMSNRNTKVLNSILFAAMVMLSINPQMLFQLSFQLSFTAMASILLFYQKIYQIFTFKNLLLIKLWQLVALNLSVQVLVLPLSIYYFKQLPIYSLFASMLSVPFIIIIMWGSILLIVSSQFSQIVTDILSYLLELIITFYMKILHIFSTLPSALIQDIKLHELQVIFWIIAIIGFTAFYFKRSKNTSMACACFIPLLLSSSFLKLDKKITSGITIYDEPKQIIIDLYHNEQVIRLMENPEMNSFQVPFNENAEIIKINPSDEISWNGYSIAILGSSFKKNIQYDFCIINSEFIVDDDLPCRKIILPRKIKKSILTNNIYSITEKGSFNLKNYQ